jgi:hypothetical protein
MRQQMTNSIERTKKKENAMHVSCQQWTKQSATPHNKPSKPTTIEAQSHHMLQLVTQKEKILKDLDNRIEIKMSEWLLFEAEVNRKMTSYTSELNHVRSFVISRLPNS